MKTRMDIRKSGGRSRKFPSLAVSLCAISLGLLPALAGAVETDRITVEDPSTGAVNFKVTSEGNVTAAKYIGDGAGLTNVPHFKGIWNSATQYAKDDCVFHGGSTWIALQQTSNAQPDLTPASWTVMAQQGPAGAPGASGSAGETGAVGPQGPQGPAGSADTQAQILSKLSGATDGTSLSLYQGPTESSSLPKFKITDRTGLDRLSFTSIGMFNLLGTNSEIHNKVISNSTRPVFAGERARGTTSVPTSVLLDDKLGSFAFSGYDGAAYQTGGLLEVFVDGAVQAGSVPSRFSIVTGSSYSNRAERMVVKSTGEVGIGATAPTQKLEVNGGVRLNTTTEKPNCEAKNRGTFWVTQKGTGVMDTLEVCIKDAAEAFIWKSIW